MADRKRTRSTQLRCESTFACRAQKVPAQSRIIIDVRPFSHPQPEGPNLPVSPIKPHTIHRLARALGRGADYLQSASKCTTILPVVTARAPLNPTRTWRAPFGTLPNSISPPSGTSKPYSSSLLCTLGPRLLTRSRRWVLYACSTIQSSPIHHCALPCGVEEKVPAQRRALSYPVSFVRRATHLALLCSTTTTTSATTTYYYICNLCPPPPPLPLPTIFLLLSDILIDATIGSHHRVNSSV